MESAIEKQGDRDVAAGGRLDVRDCGVAPYRDVLALQESLRDRRREGEVPDTVLIVEHPPVITLGARTSANRLLVEAEELSRRGIDVVEIRRGGGATAHNPGQLVFYPILHLHGLGMDVGTYVRTLEAIGIDLLDRLGVTSERRKKLPGLWVGQRKIASVGSLLAEDAPPAEAARRLGMGVAVDRSQPFALYAFLRHTGSFEETLFCAALNGGDRDTMGAMACAISGAYLGEDGIPEQWRQKLENRVKIEALATRLVALA